MRAGALLLLSATWACSSTQSLGVPENGGRDAAVDAFTADGPSADMLGLAAVDSAAADVTSAWGPTRELVFVVNHDSQDVSGFVVDLATSTATPVPGSPVAAGKYPYGLAITPDGRFLYVSDYEGNDVRGYSVGKTGALTPLPGLPVALPGPDALVMAPSGLTLYARAFSQIHGLHIDPETGALSRLPGFPVPGVRDVLGLAIDPRGRFLVASIGAPMGAGDWIRVFAAEPASGALTPLPVSPSGFPSGLRHETPGLAVDPSGQFIYATAMRPEGEDLLFGYAVDATTGNLSALAGSPWPAPDEAKTIAFHPSKRLMYFGSEDILYTYAVAADGTLTAAAPELPHQGASTAWKVSANGHALYMLASLVGELRVRSLEDPGFPPVAGSPWKVGGYPVALVTLAR
jgi:6-phosphogluconolactonase